MGQDRRATDVLPWLGLFALALAIRSLLYPLVFTDGGVEIPTGADQYYHLRRIWFTVANFPAALPFDRYVDFPNGARMPWPSTFDWGVAAVARLLVGPASQSGVEAVAVCVPPVVGALTVLAVAWLGRRHFGPAAGWLAGLLLACLPAHVMISGLAAVDHHVANAGLGVLLVGAAMEVAGPAEGRRFARGIALASALVAGVLLVWLGALLEVVVVQAVLVGQALLEPERSIARTRARGLAALHAGSAALLAPFCLGGGWTNYGSLSPVVLTPFHPLWLGSGAAALALLDALWSRAALGATRAHRIGTALALGGAGAALALLAIPGLAAALGNAAAWFQADPFLGFIWEMQPLLFAAGRFDPTLAVAQYGYLLWVYPLAVGWLIARAVRERRAEWMLLAIWSAAFAAATLLQRRFNELASPGFVLVVGAALGAAWHTVRAAFPAPAQRRSAALAGSLLLAAAILPALRDLRATADASLRLLRGAPAPELENAMWRRIDLMRRVARWLRESSPPTQGYLDPALQPEYGVLSSWDVGHLLRYYAERPLVEDNFGPYAGRAGFDAAREYYASMDEDSAVGIARRCGARYVVATRDGSGQVGVREAMAERLVPAFRPAGGLALPTPLLERHRLVFVADDRKRALAAGEPPQVAAVYEIVEGARVRGRATPGAEVRVDLRLTLPDGTALFRTASARADGAGSYALRLPYPTQETDGTAVQATEAYRVRTGEREAPLEIAEADVREGREVAGPSFAP